MMWNWFNLRRRSRRRTQHTSNVEHSSGNEDQPVTSSIEATTLQRALTGLRSITQPFFIPTQPISESPPKCISRLPCSQILYGERVEDFSPECWLENHLHRFGVPTNAPLCVTQSASLPCHLYEDTDDSITGSSDTTSSLTDYFDLDIQNELQHIPSRPLLALEQIFIPLGESDAETENSFEYCAVIEPPPYSEFDPPPTYEEAVGHSDRRSTGTRSSQASSLAIMW